MDPLILQIVPFPWEINRTDGLDKFDFIQSIASVDFSYHYSDLVEVALVLVFIGDSVIPKWQYCLGRKWYTYFL